MPKKVVKKRKWKVIGILLILLFLVLIVFGVYLLLQLRIKNILIKNTTYLPDDEIIELAEIKNYPKFFLTSSIGIKKRLEESPYIEKATVRKKWGFVLEINVVEKEPLFYDNYHQKYVLNDKIMVPEDSINYTLSLPRLLNEVPAAKYQKLVTGMGNVKEEIITKISDIEYQPNELDSDRFLLYMDDGNMVYLTLTKFKMINHYNEVLKQLENHKGILYLDNGNHFQIKE